MLSASMACSSFNDARHAFTAGEPRAPPPVALVENVLPSAVAAAVTPYLPVECCDKATQTQATAAADCSIRWHSNAHGPHSLEGMRPGLTDAHVGLLNGMRNKYMDKYYFETDKGKRAPREDLSHFTAEERVARRKMRARVYSRNARVRHRQLQDELADDVDDMRMWEAMVENAPHIVLVLSADIHCQVLYANRAVTQALCIAPERMVGMSLWPTIHPDDKEKLALGLTAMILTKTSPDKRMVVRARSAFNDYYAPFSVGLRYGTQGILCTMWPQLT